MQTEISAINGVNGASGDYLLPDLTPTQISSVIRGESAGDGADKPHLQELLWRDKNRRAGAHYGVKEGVDPKNLAEAGWGVIFSHDADPAIREALSELIDFRKDQALAKDERFFREYTGPDGYRPGESKQAFLARHGVGPGPVDPERAPYYMLVVGDPETIPYRFQYQLDVQYAVGRIHFDRLEDYAAYAHSVVQAEKQRLALPRRMAFFGTANSDDRATQISAQELITPLVDTWGKQQAGWIVDSSLGEAATKRRLGDLLGGADTPALLFTASHGVGFPKNHIRQIPHQGALLCQDWPGPRQWKTAIPEDFYFSGDDLDGNANLLGLVAFHFACYGAGTPRLDEFSQQAFRDRAEIAPHAFLSGLSKRLLANPKGGALAVLGHVDRAWGYSFLWGQTGRQLTVFESTLQRLVDGHPVGSALEYFNERYAEMASDLTVELEDISFGKEPDDLQLAGMWTANNDARNYAILGDPAVRMMVAETEQKIVERSTIELVSRPEPQFEMTGGGVLPAQAGSGDVAGNGSPASTEQPALLDDASLDYGLADGLRQMQANMGASVQQFMNNLGGFLSRALDDAASLEVSTYVSDDLSNVRYESGRFTGARLRALTRIKIDGDTLVCVPETDGEVDTELWRIHLDMLQLAQTSRADLLRTVVSAATGLAGVAKPGR
jgi:hypothetical protein